MNKYVKPVLKSLSSKKISVFFMILQIAITIFFIIFTINTLDCNKYLRKNLQQKNFDFDKTMYLLILNHNSSDDYNKRFTEFENYVENLEEVENAGTYDFSNLIFAELENNEKYTEVRQKEVKGTFKENWGNSSEVLYIEPGIYNLMQLNIKEGRPLKKDDFYKKDNNLVPALIGYNYKDVIKPGDILTDPYSNTKYQAVGILDKNQTWLSDMTWYYYLPKNLDDKFILPYTEADSQDNTMVEVKSQHYFYKINDNADLNKTQIKINEKASELNLVLLDKTMEESFNTLKNENTEIFKQNIFKASFLFLFSVIGVSLSFSSLIQKRKREIGIRMAFGASKSFICKMIIIENALIIISGFLCSLSVFFILKLKEYFQVKYDAIGINPFEVLNLNDFLILFIILIILNILTVISALYKLKKITVKELMGRND